MPKTRPSKPKVETIVLPRYVYRGRNVEVRKGPKGTRLFIDDQEIEIEETENGVLSHRHMYREFATPFELAEELIKQWGNAKPQPANKPHNHSHHK